MLLDHAIEKCKKIIGTELVGIVKQAKSPNQAAKIVEWLGYSREWIEAARAAAILIRENGKDYFYQILGPNAYKIRIPHYNPLILKIKVYDSKTNIYDFPNPVEKKKLMEIIKEALDTAKIAVTIESNYDSKELSCPSYTRFNKGEKDE